MADVTVEWALAELERIKERGRDPEAGHVMEDELREAVLLAIANGHPQAKELAEIAIRTSEFVTEKWYA